MQVGLLLKRIIISAMTQNRVIGYRGRLPWHLPEEYQHFLNSVRGKTMIMGRKSWEVFGGDVDTQVNIIVSRTQNFEGTHAAQSLEEALEIAEQKSLDCFIAGGAAIYQAALEKDLVDEMWLSEILLELEGDVFFPEFEISKWDIDQEEDRQSYVFRKYLRKT